MMIEICAPALQKNEATARLSSSVIIDGKKEILWFETDKRFAEFLAEDTLDAFVIGMLPRAMRDGHDIRVSGPLCSTIYYNLTHSLIPILSLYFNVPPIRIEAPDLKVFAPDPKAGVMAGLSCGVDSFCNYYSHSGDRAPDAFHITHFCFNNVGSHGQRGADNDRRVFHEKYEQTRVCANKLDLPLIAIDSNLDQLLPGLTFQNTHTLRNMATALAMQNGIGKVFYASSVPIHAVRVSKDISTKWMEPVLLPLLSSARLKCIPAGGQYSRIEKTQRVAEVPESTQYLDVCVHPWNATERRINCSKCWKCMRTQLTLEIMGVLDQYKPVFDLSLYHKNKKVYLLYVMASDDLFSKELRAFIDDKQYPVPLKIQYLGRFLPQRIARRILNLIAHNPKRTRFLASVL